MLSGMDTPQPTVHLSNHNQCWQANQVWSHTGVMHYKQGLLVFKRKLLTHWTPTETRRQMPEWNLVQFVKVTTWLWNVLCSQTWAWQIERLPSGIKACVLGAYFLVTTVKTVAQGTLALYVLKNTPPCCMIMVDNNPYRWQVSFLITSVMAVQQQWLFLCCCVIHHLIRR